MRSLAALTVVAIITAACGGAAAPSPTPQRTQPAAQTLPTVARSATPTPLCPAAPSQASNKATITLDKGGVIVIQLRPDKALKTVSNFAFRANKNLYDGLTFHRVEPNFVIQGGDPAGNGTGGGQQCTELNDLPFLKGAVGIARGQDINISNDFQFFVCIGECTFLNGKYTNFGTVISGQDVADAVKIGDKIKTIRVE